jgi:hypothetical protein
MRCLVILWTTRNVNQKKDKTFPGKEKDQKSRKKKCREVRGQNGKKRNIKNLNGYLR